MKKLIYLTVLSMGFLFATSCKKDKEVTPEKSEETPVTPSVPGSGTVTLNFINMAGNEALALGEKHYLTLNSDSIKIDILKYYVSNFRLVKEDGTEHNVPESYFLVDAANPSSHTAVLPNIPPGNYTSLKYIIGVDSARNVSGAQTGALDPANGMFWTWNTGYIMAKIEGSSPQSGAPGNAISFHIGGFYGSGSGVKNVELPLNTKMVVNNNSNPRINIKSDVLEWFKTPTSLELSSTYLVVTTGPLSRTIAANYADMFTLQGISY
jgi:hypothetical protein